MGGSGKRQRAAGLGPSASGKACGLADAIRTSSSPSGGPKIQEGFRST